LWLIYIYIQKLIFLLNNLINFIIILLYIQSST
jgi:hypothetical protein